ncbi:MAG: hypothetical protein RSE01_04435 [Akkermansia sp.]
MNKSRIIVLSVLLVALCALGGLYLKNQQDLSDVRAQQAMSDLQLKLKQQELELAQMRQSQGLPPIDNTSATNPALVNPKQGMPPMPSFAKNGAQNLTREQQLEKELDRMRQEKQLAQEESALLAQKTAEATDNKQRTINQVSDAKMVGKVVAYDKNNNLLIFQPIGQPNLTNGQELAIRRKGSIFVFLKVGELDPTTGSYDGEVKRNELFDSDTQSNINKDDEVIIPPIEVKTELPDLKSTTLPKDLPPIPLEPDFTPNK